MGFLRILSSILHPIPGIALLPLAILWFGIGEFSIIFVIIHSVLWPMLLNAYSGFKNIDKTQLDVAKNLGLNKTQIVLKVMIPSAFTELITGLKISWARAWRALISGEMVFGVSGASGGLGWFIYEKGFYGYSRSVCWFDYDCFVRYSSGVCYFGIIQKNTIEKWGMQVANL